MDRDIIIIVKGGSIQGIFGAGVLAAFEKHDLYPKVHSVYAVSFGAHSAAYFLSQGINIMPHIYYDHLCKNPSAIVSLSFKLICKKLWDVFIRNKSADIIDLDYIENLEKNVIKLDFEKIKKSPINFFVRVLNRQTLKLEYLDARDQTLERIIQSSKIPPYSYSRKDDVYIDGGIMPTRDFIHNVIKKHTDKKIIYIFNDKKTFGRIVNKIPWDILDIMLKAKYLGFRYGLKHLFSIFNYPYISSLKKYPHVYPIYNELNINKREKNRDKVYRAYIHGFSKGEEILKKIGHIAK
ncbi:MAG: hypothetical protein PHO91_04055 [Patescibacteria group bacterium]|nr:hypothetical protein [Patescibacteria group bacterium]